MKILLRLLVVLGIGFGFPIAASAQEMSITFMGRPTSVIDGSVGHAFFCISLPVGTGPREECFGFYPVNVSQALSGPGRVTNEFTRDNILNVSVSLRHRITPEARRNIYAVIARWAGADYRLLVNNCGDFLFDVARAAGLQTPPRDSVTFPTEFVEGLRRSYWSGSWTTTDPASRFSVRVNSAAADWTERAQGGASLTKTVPFAPGADDSVRIERANADDVLAFLGFQPTIRGQILAAGPRPSYMIMRRIDGRATAQWYGLLVIKDEQANLRELKQPGSMPPRDFEMSRLP